MSPVWMSCQSTVFCSSTRMSSLWFSVHPGSAFRGWVGSDRRTDSGGLNHVADGESLDGLVLGGASRAVGATDRLDVAPAVLVAAAANQMLAMVLAAPSRVCVVAAWDMYARGVAVLGRSLLDHLCDLRRVGSAGG